MCSNERVTLNFGWLDVGTIIHEFGHVLGLIHEHQNPQGHIQWNDAKVYAWAKQTQGWDEETTYHNIIERYNSSQINGSQFDPKSIMLYFFPAYLTTDNKGTNANHILSALDIEYISKIYPGGHMSPSQFYKWAYHEGLSSGDSSNGSSNWKDILKYVLIGFGILLVILILYKLSQKIGGKRKFYEHTSYKEVKAYNPVSTPKMYFV